MKAGPVFLVAGLMLVSPVCADEPPEEIEYLLTAIGSSGCAFVRNGSRHSATEAEDHLRMKYRRGKRYAPTAETFIERLASKSSISKEPYFIACPGETREPSGEWLSRKLADYRKRK
jgi:hypothetical protein